MPKVIRCNKCGLCYPLDYIARWGREYGRGLGPVPMCEGLSSNYSRPFMPRGQVATSEEQLMHPLEVCRGSVNIAEVTEKELKDNTPILAATDKGMKKRAPIMRAIQLENSQALQAAVANFKPAA